MNRISWVETAGVGIGLVGLILAVNLDQDRFIPPALLILGVGLFTAGVEAAFTHRVGVLTRLGTNRPYWGVAARPWSFFFMLLGAGLAFAGLMTMIGLGENLQAVFLRRPGMVLLSTGSALLAVGVATLIGPPEWRVSLLQILVHIPHRFGGLLMAGVGLGAVVLGVFEIIAPSAFDSWVQSILPVVPSIH